MKYILYGTGVLLWFFSCSSPADTNDTASHAWVQQVDSVMERRLEKDLFHGSIVIGSRDSVIYTKEFGLANRGWNIPVTNDTRFDIASLNKSFIAALMLLAEEEEKLSLESRLTDQLAEYKFSGEFNSEITLAQLLSHFSGLPDYDAVDDGLSANGFRRLKRLHVSNAEYVDFISKLPPVQPPGQGFYYSNFAYHLLAIILEDVYQKPFDDILQEKICIPLGMKHTFSPGSNQHVYDQVAEAYTFREDKDQWVRNDFIDFTLGRRIYSTSHDLFLWGQAMSDDRLLSESSLASMQTNYHSGNISYGYGWVVYNEGASYAMGDLGIDLPYIIHGGSTDGYRSMLVNVNRGDLIVTFLSNVGDRSDEMGLADEIIKIINP